MSKIVSILTKSYCHKIPIEKKSNPLFPNSFEKKYIFVNFESQLMTSANVIFG